MNNLIVNDLVTAPQTRAIADSGCTIHFLGANNPCTNTLATTNGILVGLTNGASMQGTHTTLLLFPQLSLVARRANIFPALHNRALIAIGQMCNNGFSSTFSKDHLTLVKQDITITGERNTINGLYYIDLTLCSQPIVQNTLTIYTACVHSTYEMSKSDLVHYLHCADFSPVISTWTKAINAVYYTTWSSLTSQLVRKNLPKALATAQGHLRQHRRNIRSIKFTATHSIENNMPEMTMQSVPLKKTRVRTKMAFLNSIKVIGKISTDQTGRLAVTSSRGSKYLIVIYDHDSNAIIAEPLKSRSEHELIRIYSALHTHLSNRGLAPKVQILDNECPDGLKQVMRNAGVAFQFVLPHLHRTNAAKRAIATYKDHLIAVLRSCNPSFPMHLWYRFIPQSTLTLNLLRQSRINPHLSAEAQLNGAFDFNRTPLAPPGTKVLVFEAPGFCPTWAPHGVTGWYIGSAPRHYRCYRVYILKT